MKIFNYTTELKNSMYGKYIVLDNIYFDFYTNKQGYQLLVSEPHHSQMIFTYQITTNSLDDKDIENLIDKDNLIKLITVLSSTNIIPEKYKMFL
jgi:hypothetical protein